MKGATQDACAPGTARRSHAELDPVLAARRRRLWRVALLVLPLGVLANVLWTLLATDAELLGALDELPRTHLVTALVLGLVPQATGTLRLLVWSRFLGHRLPMRELVRMTLAVDLGSAMSPTAVGGEGLRWALLVRHGVSPGQAATLALFPKIEDAVFFALALPVAIVWTAAWELPAVVNGTALLGENARTLGLLALGLTAVGWIAVRVARRRAEARAAHGRLRAARWRARVRRALRDALAALAEIRRRGKTRFVLTLGLTAIHWITRYSVVSATALFLGVPFDPVLFWLLQWVVFSLMSLVPTPGAAGGAEVAFTAVYAPLLPSGTLGVATAAWRLFTFYAPLAVAAVAFPLLEKRTAPAAA